nr:catalase [Psychrobacter sp. PraFG1]UNK04935.1 catalase [Psychrobacter sp. PraFG1]
MKDNIDHKDPANQMNPAVGEGGETHQRADKDGAVLTTQQGVAISDNQNSLKAGPRGPSLLEDFILREKLPILTMSVFQSVLCMHAVQGRMAILN